MGGGGQTVTTQAPQQVVPQGAAGYTQASDFYKNILNNPPVYQGQRVAGETPAQTQAFQSASYLTDPANAQAAVSGLAEPLFQRFTSETMPGIRDTSQRSGQGVTGSRRQVATEGAISALGEGLATGAVAPIYTAMPAALSAEAALGESQRQIQQQQLTGQQQQFEEPLARASQAANALFQAAGLGPGGSSASTSMGALGTGQAISSSLSSLGTAYALMKAGSAK